MKCVILISPFHGRTEAIAERYKEYLNECISDCLKKNESPYASHKMLTDSLDDNISADREKGIEAGHKWYSYADHAVAYTDYGISEGMKEDFRKCASLGLIIHHRKLYEKK